MLITSIENLPPALAAAISPAEKNYIAEIQLRGQLPFAVTPHFASLALPDTDDPIRRQFFPDPREALPDPFALDDPLGEYRYRCAPQLVHQYHDRALLLSAGACAGYCRYCFRRVWLASSPPAAGTDALQPAYGAALAYVAAQPAIREVLISGGDPLTLDNAGLVGLFCQLRQARPAVMLRVCTRMPITEPSRMDSETIALFAQFRPLRLVVHINHPRELSAPSRAVFAACADAGIPIHVQTVLLRGINDDPALLAGLFRECLDLGLLPYYLFQMDLAPGTAHFRVPLKQGLAIYRALSGLISGSGLPAYAVDLPGGGGKIRLHEHSITGEKMTANGTAYILKDTGDGEWYYPA
ncbi:MAG: KamA family radical SAM protein [Treponema sp.]|nr:KamA family radical SAM protein [Treponema sp.]